MRILLDECVDPRLRTAFPDHDVRTVFDLGWNRLKNGELLAAASGEFDVFVTIDKASSTSKTSAGCRWASLSSPFRRISCGITNRCSRTSEEHSKRSSPAN